MPSIRSKSRSPPGRFARFGGASFAVAHEVVRADGTLLARGNEKRVWGRFQNGPGTPMKGEQIPEDVRALFREK